MKYKPTRTSASFRQWLSTQAQRDPSKTLPRSSANATTGNAEAKRDDGTGHTLSPGDPLTRPTQPPTVNVVLFGETGVGKSSVINLIAQKEVAKVSSDVNGCTMQSTRYDISFDDMNFAIFDTIGLEEPQIGVNGYLKAIEKAYELIVELGAAGGIHLLLFCMRGGRITATTQSNYRLFCECLCNKKVPVALVFTGLERELEMEDWWKRNENHIIHYGIKSDGHACITAVQDETPGEDPKYAESQRKIRDLLKTCALKNDAFSLEPHSWLAKFGNLMRSLIKKHKIPGRRNVMRVLTQRCKLDPETARKIMDMMDKNDGKAEDGSQAGNRNDHRNDRPQGENGKRPHASGGGGDQDLGEQTGKREGEGRPKPGVGSDENESDTANHDIPEGSVDGVDEDAAGYHTAIQQDDTEDEPRPQQIITDNQRWARMDLQVHTR